VGTKQRLLITENQANQHQNKPSLFIKILMKCAHPPQKFRAFSPKRFAQKITFPIDFAMRIASKACFLFCLGIVKKAHITTKHMA
jgi:hypothetical protein